METIKSIEIIESMFKESKKSMHRNSFYFIIWGVLMIIAGIAEFFMYGNSNFWIIWPVVSFIGTIASMVYGMKEGKNNGVQTAGDRINSFTWGAFMFTLIFAIVYSVYNYMSPHPIVLMLAGSATFISGGISKFKPFIWGAVILEAGAILAAFFIEPEYHGLVSAFSLLFGYVIPGIILRNSEND